ncbi:Rpusd1 [Symbiodinium natans]|uniref:Rpusd1 protein n=1 Tax=Symbiodinium natans TaxID=878477 RepID=A0A812T6T8_9DINO|nr:Rpusd1 [Symbiodinium natans]
MPWDESRGRFTFQAYLPAVIGPPTRGVPCRGPRVCHRLDFRVGGPMVVATSEEAIRSLMFCFAEQLVEKEYRAIVSGKVEEEGASFTIDEPVDGRAACTDVKVLKVAPCPHHGHLTELALSPRQGRYRQLRRHCAEALGAPIVNEDAGVVYAAAEAWRRRGKALPSPLVRHVGRGKGNLFLQKLRVSLPPPEDLGSSERVTVEVPPSDRFELLMDTSARAFEYGWRTDQIGETKLMEDHVDDSEARQEERANASLGSYWSGLVRAWAVGGLGFQWSGLVGVWSGLLLVWACADLVRLAGVWCRALSGLGCRKLLLAHLGVFQSEVQQVMRDDPQRLDRIAGGQDLQRVAESPLLTGRVIAQLAAEESYRKPPYVTPPGLTGGVCIVAEAARDLGLRDGGPPGSAAGDEYGPERPPAPSIRSLGFLGPGALRAALPEPLKALADPGGLLANDEVRIPLEFMAQGPPPS